MIKRLETLRDTTCEWFLSQCLPRWSDAGFDPAFGGFVEAIERDGSPVSIPRRAMVQGRQVFTFSIAGQLGWTGPWRDRVQTGIETLRHRYQRPDGAYRHSVSADGQHIVRDEADLYTQAFVLLALAQAYQALDKKDGLEQSAKDLSRILANEYRAPIAGFTESSGNQTILRSNPNMHVLEANLAWLDATNDNHWEKVCLEIVDLCQDKLVPNTRGGLREYFSPVDWSPSPGRPGQIIEPGHQFEWAWLLIRWYRRSGENRVLELAQDLVAVGENGICPDRRVPYSEILPNASPINPIARLWPNTERLKACMAMLEVGEGSVSDHIEHAEESVRGIYAYFKGNPAGLFRDRWLVNREFDDEPSRASSMYHIACAVGELDRVTDLLCN